MLQRNAPLPAGAPRNRFRVGMKGALAFARDGDGAVAEEPVRPVLVAGLERSFDEKSAKAGAIDEEVAADGFAAFENDRFDEAVAVALSDGCDLAFGASHTAVFRIAAQVLRIERRIEMKSVC